MIDISIFKNNLFEAGTEFFNQLGIRLNSNTATSLSAKELLKDQYRDKDIFEAITETYFLGLVDDSVFGRNVPLLKNDKISLQEAADKINADYNGLMVFAVKLDDSYSPARGKIAELTRSFNRVSKNIPVVLLLQYGDLLSFAASERTKYKQECREGERLGKVSLLKDINIDSPHTGHLKILNDLKVAPNVKDFNALYEQWQEVFNVRLLNEEFYTKLSAWYYYALSKIKLPIKPEYYKTDRENVKNFTVRLICRTIFCWFLKEKGLISDKLLEIDEKKIKLIKDHGNESFYDQNSYYRGVLQNIFFASLNTPMVPEKGRSKKNYFGLKYLSDDFDFGLFDSIPFLNGGLFEKLEEDNCNDTFEDGAISIPNELFYSDEIHSVVGNKTKETKGLNKLLAQYKFTVAENTPMEEEIALDPELLGLVFENLLAEIDPDENVAKVARKATGSFYTPRKIIDYMVNESLLLYLRSYFNERKLDNSKLNTLIYFERVDEDDKNLCRNVLNALDDLKVLDPACGSGAFPMGMLHKVVTLLNLVDPENEMWIEAQLQKLTPELRQQTKKDLKRHELNYARKLGLVRNCIYGIDIQPMAVMITKLRFFISLLIEQDIDKKALKENYHISPLPNLETKILCADSLQDAQPQLDIFQQDSLDKLIIVKEKYYQNQNIKSADKEKLIDEITEIMSECFPDFSERITGKKYKDKVQQKQTNKKYLKEWFQHANISSPFFNLDVFFPEAKDKRFDIVIGNPPYGGSKITDEVKDNLVLGSKDPYGAFIARFLGDGSNNTPLKTNGVLAYIVSDTFMTIKSHFALRKQMMSNYVHKMIRVHPDTFKATVNTAIILCEKNMFPKDMPVDERIIDSNHYCRMADLTTINIHDNYERFLEVLYKTEGFETGINYSDTDYAIYYYPQSLIRTNSNLPFFVASPKLFGLMNDTSAQIEHTEVSGKRIQMRKINLNGKELVLIKLEQIAEAKQGLKTGDNDAYLFQNPEARGTYRSINDFNCFLLSDAELLKIRNDNNTRTEIINKGISKGNNRSKRYFKGGYIVPLDKGGESDTDEGWMPNYYVPTDYYIDWSEWAVQRMKTLTIKERDGRGQNRICSRFQNIDHFFNEGITFSPTGIYAPSFRINSSAVFESKGSTIFFEKGVMEINILLGLLASKFIKYQLKNYISHTVETGEAVILAVHIIFNLQKKIGQFVDQIVSKQKINARYDYASNEQIEIDKLVYEAYGLNEEDIQEVENWYARRYPKLVRTQNNS